MRMLKRRTGGAGQPFSQSGSHCSDGLLLPTRSPGDVLLNLDGAGSDEDKSYWAV